MKLIDEREWKALYDEMEGKCIVWGQYDKGYLDALNCVDDWFDAHPNVEMETVKHGQWINPRIIVGGFAEEWGADCSCCGKTHVGNRTAYCPNCGARMDGEDGRKNK